MLDSARVTYLRTERLVASNRVLRYTQHAAVAACEGVDFDFGILTDVNEADTDVARRLTPAVGLG